MLCGSVAGKAVLQARREAWQEAFLSLKAAVRCSACPAFYILSPQVCAHSSPVVPDTS